MGGRGHRRNRGGNKRRNGRGGHRNRRNNKKGFGANLKPIDWRNQTLQPFQKDFYEGRISNQMKPAEIQQWRSKYQMSVIGENCPQPVRTFEECGLPQSFLQKFQRLGFKAPTPIQSQGWPMALTGRDVVGIAQTGSGKTLAFILPAIIHVQGQNPLRRGDGPIVLIVAPTRELACQIEEEAKQFAPYRVNLTCVYGGASQRPQANALRQGVEICVCTPGRMLDFLESEVTNFRRVSMLIFDEADRMLDMGFEKQIRCMVNQIRPDRQVLMWSATWPKEVRQLASDFLKQGYVKLKVGSDEGKANLSISQQVHIVSSYEKNALFQKTLQEHYQTKVIIFTGTKRMCDDLSRQLNSVGWRTNSIHGDKNQDQRERALADFKSGRTTIMVATDVAARGIHVNDIGCVINYDFPQNCDDYIHRIGRTGRAGKTGIAVTFFDPRQDSKKASRLVKVMEQSQQEVPQQLRAIAAQHGSHGGRNRYKNNRRGGGRGRGGRGGGRGHSRSFRPY